MRKMTVPRAEMAIEAEKAKARQEETKLWEQERPTTGRVLRVTKGATKWVTLVMRS